jgi:hypothetical protein
VRRRPGRKGQGPAATPDAGSAYDFRLAPHRERLWATAFMVVVLAVVTAGPVFAVSTNNHGAGDGVGGDDFVHADSGNYTATSGGGLNNPHLDDCGVICTPL